MKSISLKKLMMALLIGVAVPCVNAQTSQVAHVGDILCTSGVYVSPAEYENSGLEAMGVIFYVDATGQHGWAVALEDAGSFDWEPVNYLDTPLSNYTTVRAAVYDLNGQFNTQEVLDFSLHTYPAFEAIDVANGWYLPAIGQLNYFYGNLVEVNAGLTVAEGTTFDMSSSWDYWSSTECSQQNAWYLSSSGKVDAGGNWHNKNNIKRVRGVRNF